MSRETALQAVVTRFTKRLLDLIGAHARAVINALHTEAAGAVRATEAFPRKRTRASTRGEGAPRPRARKVMGGARSAKTLSSTKGSSRSPRAASRSDGKSSSAEVVALGEKIVAVLGKSERHLATREILKALDLPTSAAVRLQYALGKLKKSGTVKQYGERGGARYAVRRP